MSRFTYDYTNLESHGSYTQFITISDRGGEGGADGLRRRKGRGKQRKTEEKKLVSLFRVSF